jgi:Domain of unknown function (DUF4408)
MSMYSTTHQVATPVNGIGGMNDGSGTINPAALNSSGALLSLNQSPVPKYQLGLLMLECLFLVTNFIIATIFPLAKLTTYYVAAVLAQASTAASPRGVKRSRSPDQLEESWVGADDDGTYDFCETVSRFLRGQRPSTTGKISFPLSHEVGVYSADLIAPCRRTKTSQTGQTS